MFSPIVHILNIFVLVKLQLKGWGGGGGGGAGYNLRVPLVIDMH